MVKMVNFVFCIFHHNRKKMLVNAAKNSNKISPEKLSFVCIS